MAHHEHDELTNRWKVFQGLDGIPFRTGMDGVPHYRNADPSHMKPKVVADMHVRQFDLRDDSQRKQMEEILDNCAKGRGYVSKMETCFDPQKAGFVALLIWGELFLEDPREQEIRNDRTTY